MIEKEIINSSNIRTHKKSTNTILKVKSTANKLQMI